MRTLSSTQNQKSALINEHRFKNLSPKAIKFSIIGIMIFATTVFYYYQKLIGINIFLDKNSPVSVVVTISNRYGHLQRTLDSFLQKNTYPVKEIIIANYGPPDAQMKNILSKYRTLTWLFLGQKFDEGTAIDHAYKLVKTPWIFHMENDWEFIHEGFIEWNMKYLQEQKDVINLYLGERAHKYDPQTLIVYQNKQSGFSFSPGLKRRADYKLLGEGGYKNISSTYNITDSLQKNIAAYYSQVLNFKTAQSNKIFVKRIEQNTLL